MTTRHRLFSYGTPEFFLDKLEHDLETEETSAPSLNELFDRLATIWTDDDRQFVHSEIEKHASRLPIPVIRDDSLERKLPEREQIDLVQVLQTLVADANYLVPRDRHIADCSVARLTRLISTDRAWTVIEPWFVDTRPFRTRVVVRVLIARGIPESLQRDVIEHYRATKDRGLLRLIACNPKVAAVLEETDLIDALSEPLEDFQIGFSTIVDKTTRLRNMQAFEAYLIGGNVPSEILALEYPMAFVWAVGRRLHKPSLPLLRLVLDAYKNDAEFVWRCKLAFERIGEEADIEFVRSLARNLVIAQRARRRSTIMVA